ncbi:MAG: glutathionylspermidine synthase family protein [Campylobacterales bacterium]|nr:glutathionylspermidine synthase family protein [Campylobacterales bacterium]
MIKLQNIKPLETQYLERLGFAWHTDSDNTKYIADELVIISEQEAKAFYDAGNELYDMFVNAAQFVIDNNLFHEIGIPFNLVELIKESWENDIHWHLYGRFDLAGGIDGLPIKLLEFNADTPTSLFESAIVQWAMLKYNDLEESSQFNGIYEALTDNFKRLVTLEDSIEDFEIRYDGWKFLFSSIRGNIEEENTVKLLQHMASEAGFDTNFAFVDEIEFSDDGIFYNNEQYELWFKLIPWEMIALETPDLAMILSNIIKNHKAIFFNPAYTLLFQSKGILKIMWDLYPNHPLLLESSFAPLKDKKHVKKPFLGREGENVSIIDKDGNLISKQEGEYDNHKMLFQEYANLAIDNKGNYYQAGLFFAYESCGVGFRKGGDIINNTSKFVGHIID